MTQAYRATATRRGALLAMASCGTLAACGGLLPQAPPSNLYTLSPKSTYPADLPKVKWQLVVEEPFAAGGLDTHRIAIMTSPYEVKYFPEARWAERAPRMVQTLLIESFENSGSIVAVGRQSVGLRSDYNLKIEMREFQAELKPGSAVPDAHVVMNVKLVGQPRQEIVASSGFERRAPAKSSAMIDVVQAFDEALGRVLRDVVVWTLRNGR